jgi:hypothetical protein
MNILEEEEKLNAQRHKAKMAHLRQQLEEQVTHFFNHNHAPSN